MATVVPSYKGFRYPVEIISHCVWLYHRFPLSLGVQRVLERDPASVAIFAGHGTYRPEL
jgi:transposase-like protein